MSDNSEIDTIDELEMSPKEQRRLRRLGEIYDYWNARNAQRGGKFQQFNGSTRFVNWSLAILNGLVIAAAAGGVIMYGRLNSVETKVEMVNSKVDLIIAGHLK